MMSFILREPVSSLFVSLCTLGDEWYILGGRDARLVLEYLLRLS